MNSSQKFCLFYNAFAFVLPLLRAVFLISELYQGLSSGLTVASLDGIHDLTISMKMSFKKVTFFIN